MSEVFETMTRGKVGIYTIRVWRESESFQFRDSECEYAIASIVASDPAAIFEAVKKISQVSKCEITNAAGQGVVWYRDWP